MNRSNTSAIDVFIVVNSCVEPNILFGYKLIKEAIRFVSLSLKSHPDPLAFDSGFAVIS